MEGLEHFFTRESIRKVGYITDPGSLFGAQSRGEIPLTGYSSALVMAIEGVRLKLYESIFIIPLLNQLYDRLF